MKENTKKTGSAFWILLIVGAKSLFMSLSSLAEVSSEAEVLLRALALIAAASAFIAARLLWKELEIVRYVAVVPFVALIALFVSLPLVGHGDIAAGGSIIGCSFILLIGGITIYKIHGHFRAKYDANLQQTT